MNPTTIIGSLHLNSVLCRVINDSTSFVFSIQLKFSFRFLSPCSFKRKWNGIVCLFAIWTSRIIGLTRTQIVEVREMDILYMTIK